MDELPDQKRLWDAYGHAMGAATGVKLLMRIALFDAARKRHPDSSETRQREAARIKGMTFGQTAREFQEVYTEFASDEKFVESIGNARDVRNGFAHHFLEGRLDGLRTKEGVDLIALECMEATNHFRSLDEYIRNPMPG